MVQETGHSPILPANAEPVRHDGLGSAMLVAKESPIMMQTRKFTHSPATAAVVSIAAAAVMGPAIAGNAATQTVTYEVGMICELSVSGNPAALTVGSATAGSLPNAVTESSTTYAITLNTTNEKITGMLNSAMPDGVTLEVQLAKPAGAGGGALTALSTNAADLVTGLSTRNESGLGITYRLSALPSAGVVGSSSKTVTFTLTD